VPHGGFRIPGEPIVLPTDEIKLEPAEDLVLPHEEADTNTENWETESLGSSVWDNDEIAFG
jgi:hypothetical protein